MFKIGSWVLLLSFVASALVFTLQNYNSRFDLQVFSFKLLDIPLPVYALFVAIPALVLAVYFHLFEKK